MDNLNEKEQMTIQGGVNESMGDSNHCPNCGAIGHPVPLEDTGYNFQCLSCGTLWK